MPEAPSYAVWLDRDVVEAVGEESAAFLQGQLSQDVLGIPDGGSAWSWVLSPQGKVDALARVTRVAQDRWLLDTDRGWGESLVERLNRFKLRTKVTIEQGDCRVLGIRGAPLGGFGPAVAADLCWPGVIGVDVIGPAPQVPAGWHLIDDGEYEAERIRMGFPKRGSELDEKTIPGETGLVPRTVSFTKGCYTGQELVARVDSRGGNVPRRLAKLTSFERVEPGAALVTSGGQAAGLVTSAATSPDGSGVALGYLKRGIDPAGSLKTEDGVDVAIEGLVS